MRRHKDLQKDAARAAAEASPAGHVPKTATADQQRDWAAKLRGKQLVDKYITIDGVGPGFVKEYHKAWGRASKHSVLLLTGSVEPGRVWRDVLRREDPITKRENGGAPFRVGLPPRGNPDEAAAVDKIVSDAMAAAGHLPARPTGMSGSAFPDSHRRREDTAQLQYHNGQPPGSAAGQIIQTEKMREITQNAQRLGLRTPLTNADAVKSLQDLGMSDEERLSFLAKGVARLRQPNRAGRGGAKRRRKNSTRKRRRRTARKKTRQRKPKRTLSKRKKSRGTRRRNR